MATDVERSLLNTTDVKTIKLRKLHMAIRGPQGNLVCWIMENNFQVGQVFQLFFWMKQKHLTSTGIGIQAHDLSVTQWQL